MTPSYFNLDISGKQLPGKPLKPKLYFSSGLFSRYAADAQEFGSEDDPSEILSTYSQFRIGNSTICKGDRWEN